MEDGVCSAAQQRMADELGISRVTFCNHLETLVTAGYLEDKTPGLLGVPHTYRDTGKAGLSISFTAQPVKNIDTSCKKSLQPPVKNLYSKIVVKKEINKDTTTREKEAAVFTAYQDSIAMLDGHMRDVLSDYLDNLKIPPEWMIDAFHIAAEHNKRNWAYCAAILKRWAVEGKTALPPKPTPSGPKYPLKGSRAVELAQLERIT